MRRTVKFLVAILLISTFAISATAAPRAAAYDYFGTGRSNYTLLGEVDNQWVWLILRNPVTNPLQTRVVFWGLSESDQPVFGDWDGDLKTDIAVWRPGTISNPQSWFYIQPSGNPNSIIARQWGAAGDAPVTGDFDGDGKDDFAVTRRESGQLIWYILPSGGGSSRRVVFGAEFDGHLSYVQDFNGDGRDDLLAGRDGADGTVTFYIGDSQTGALLLTQQWGNSRIADLRIFIGNYVGDSRADIAAYYGVCSPMNPTCGVAGTWWIKETGSNNYTVTRFGIPFNYQTGEGDFGEIGDYDGDGKLDITVVRLSGNTLTLYHLLSSNGQIAAQFINPAATFPLDSRLGDFLTAAPRSERFPVGLFQTINFSRDQRGAFAP